MTDYRLEIINRQEKLSSLVGILAHVPALALDIETIDWWDKYRERVALVQIAYRIPEQGIKVAVIDALAQRISLEDLRPVLESPDTIKAVHNAAFDAGKLFKHYKFRVAPVFDTMAAARRNGEKKYSLAAQTATHLNLRLDKSAQRSDWSRRPLDIKQLDYAARDAFATLLLYEHQTSRNLTGNYHLKFQDVSSVQGRLDLTESPCKDSPLNGELKTDARTARHDKTSSEERELSREAQALISIITKFPDRYGPAQLAASVGVTQRVGVVGWITDNTLGRETDFDEETAQLMIADLFDQKLIRINEFQKLETIDRKSMS